LTGDHTLTNNSPWYTTLLTNINVIWSITLLHNINDFKWFVLLVGRVWRVWRYQRGINNPYIEEKTTQWPKEKVEKDKQRPTKHTQSTWWRSFQKNWYLRLYYYHWVDTSAGELLVADGINRPIVSMSAPTGFIRYICYWNLQFLNIVIITKTNVLLPQEYAILGDLGYPVDVLCFYCSEIVLSCLAFQPFDFERTWWRLLRFVHTNFDIYVLLLYFLEHVI